MSSFTSTTALLVLLAAICVFFPTQTQGASYLVGCSSSFINTPINTTLGGITFLNNGTRGTMLPAQGTPAQRAAAQAAAAAAFFNPANPLSPASPLNPVNPLNPANPLSPTSLFNPLNPISPLNVFNPVGVTNPLSPFNPLGLTNPLSPNGPLNPFSILNPLNPVNPINVLGRSLYQLALLSREPIITPPNNGQPVQAGSPFTASFLLRDIASLNVPGAKIRITIRGMLDNIQVNCSNPIACVLSQLVKNNTDGVTVIEFPLLSPGFLPLSVIITGTPVEDRNGPSNQRGGPIGRISVTVDIVIPVNQVVPSNTAGLNVVVKYCMPGGLSDGQCSNRCHNNKRRCNRDPGCKWFRRSYSCVKRK